MDEFRQHTYAICAYKESKYLEDCIQSLIGQETKSNIIMVTSTPNAYIQNMAEKYSVELYVRNGKSDIQDDWNFACSSAKTKYVTIAHQDDVYCSKFTTNLKLVTESCDESIIIFTKYKEIKNNSEIPLTINIKIKNIMLFPLKFKMLRSKKFIKKMILAFGSPICCPSVTYNKEMNDEKIFTSEMKCSLDWDTWYKISKKSGDFIYIDQYLMQHRIHEESETTNSISNNVRQNEDYNMFLQFWPKFIAKILSKLYSKSLNTNKM